MIDIIAKVLLIVFLWIALGYLVFIGTNDKNFHKPTLWWFIFWPLVAMSYLISSVSAFIAATLLVIAYLITRPFEKVLNKMWAYKDSDIEGGDPDAETVL